MVSLSYGIHSCNRHIAHLCRRPRASEFTHAASRCASHNVVASALDTACPAAAVAGRGVLVEVEVVVAVALVVELEVVAVVVVVAVGEVVGEAVGVVLE